MLITLKKSGTIINTDVTTLCYVEKRDYESQEYKMVFSVPSGDLFELIAEEEDLKQFIEEFEKMQLPKQNTAPYIDVSKKRKE